MLKASPVHLDWLTLTGPKGWLGTQEAKAGLRQAEELWPGPVPGEIAIPVDGVNRWVDDELTPVLHVQPWGVGAGRVRCPQWFAHESVGRLHQRYMRPAVTLTGLLLRTMGWQGAYETVSLIWRRLAGCAPPALTVSRVDVALEFPRLSFEQHNRGEWSCVLARFQDDVVAWMGEGARSVAVKSYTRSDEGVTYYVRHDPSGLLWRGYHKYGEGIRVELQQRSVVPDEEGVDTHGRVWWAVQRACTLWVRLGLPFSCDEPVLRVSSVDGRPLHGVPERDYQDARTRLARGRGLILSVLGEDEHLVAQFLDVLEKANEALDSQQRKAWEK